MTSDLYVNRGKVNPIFPYLSDRGHENKAKSSPEEYNLLSEVNKCPQSKCIKPHNMTFQHNVTHMFELTEIKQLHNWNHFQNIIYIYHTYRQNILMLC